MGQYHIVSSKRLDHSGEVSQLAYSIFHSDISSLIADFLNKGRKSDKDWSHVIAT